MKIHSLYFSNTNSGWEVREVQFDQLNLIVGVSGSGKSQMLNALWLIRGIALGKPLSGVKWKIVFSSENIKYEWSGAFGKLRFSSANRPSAVEQSSNTERLAVIGTNQSIERTEKGYVVISDPELGSDTKPKQIPPKEAGNGLLFQLYSKEYAFINRALQGFEKMVFRDHTLSQADIRADFYRVRLPRPYPRLVKEMTIGELRKSGFSTSERLFIASKNELEEVNMIGERFKSIFSEVIDWKKS